MWLKVCSVNKLRHWILISIFVFISQEVARERQRLVEHSSPGQLASLSHPLDIPLPKLKGHSRARSEERAKRKAAEDAEAGIAPQE